MRSKAVFPSPTFNTRIVSVPYKKYSVGTSRHKKYCVGRSFSLQVIFFFEIHHRFGPILFCIRSVMWDIMSIIGSFLIAVFAFGVGLVSVFGIFQEEGAFEHFDDFKSTFKTLFWIIMDPGKEEYSDIELEVEEGLEEVEEGGKNPCSAKKVAKNITR